MKKTKPDWRLAFMFDAGDAGFDAMSDNLARAASQIRQLVGDAHIRLGVADQHPDLRSLNQPKSDPDGGRTVDGAIEVSVSNSRHSELSDIAIALHKLLVEIAEPSSIEVMAGPYYSMVPVRDGSTFLSLAFQRDSAITSAQFQSWWYDQHSALAIPVLGPSLLAYDQVHLDAPTNQALADAIGIAPSFYDAYDNLTWASHYAFFESISNEEEMAPVYQDEVGRIDKSTQRSAVMRKLNV